MDTTFSQKIHKWNHKFDIIISSYSDKWIQYPKILKLDTLSAINKALTSPDRELFHNPNKFIGVESISDNGKMVISEFLIYF